MKTSGFTLVELIVVTVITLLVGTGVLAGYSNYNDTQRLKQAAATLKNDLRFAQNRAMSAVKPTGACPTLVGYSVSITANSYSIQARCTGGLVGDITMVNLGTGIRFSAFPAQITYEVLSGAASSDSTITVEVGSKHINVVVAKSGDINESPMF